MFPLTDKKLRHRATNFPKDLNKKVKSWVSAGAQTPCCAPGWEKRPHPAIPVPCGHTTQ